MASNPTKVPLGSVLVTGGNGFLGRPLVSALHKDPSCTSITVIDRVAPMTRLENVEYFQGSITSREDILHVLKLCKPNVVIHAASPNVTFPTSDKDFYATNVDGTRTLLELSKSFGVKAFVFSSSTDAYSNLPHNNISESHPLWDETSHVGPYPITKAIADRMVREAATGDFPTVSLRGTHLYGDGDTQAIPVALDACAGSKPLFRLGEGKNFMEIMSTDNAASAHIHAAKALLDPSLANGKVSGQAFNISDGNPALFWRFFEVIWSTARGRDIKPEMWIIPAWLVMFMISTTEWIFWIFTCGLKKPQGMNQMERAIMEYCIHTFTYDCSKFREVANWKPDVVNWEEILAEATRWEMRKRESKKFC